MQVMVSRKGDSLKRREISYLVIAVNLAERDPCSPGLHVFI